jgi:hypothetical protein
MIEQKKDFRLLSMNSLPDFTADLQHLEWRLDEMIAPKKMDDKTVLEAREQAFTLTGKKLFKDEKAREIS